MTSWRREQEVALRSPPSRTPEPVSSLHGFKPWNLRQTERIKIVLTTVKHNKDWEEIATLRIGFICLYILYTLLSYKTKQNSICVYYLFGFFLHCFWIVVVVVGTWCLNIFNVFLFYFIHLFICIFICIYLLEVLQFFQCGVEMITFIGGTKDENNRKRTGRKQIRSGRFVLVVKLFFICCLFRLRKMSKQNIISLQPLH